MATAQRSRGAARSIVSLGHLLVGGAALVFAGVMIVAGSDSGLGGVFLPWDCCSRSPQESSMYTAAMVLRRAPRDRSRPLPDPQHRRTRSRGRPCLRGDCGGAKLWRPLALSSAAAIRAPPRSRGRRTPVLRFPQPHPRRQRNELPLWGRSFGRATTPPGALRLVHRFHRLMTGEQSGGHTSPWEAVGCQGAAEAHRRNATGREFGCQRPWHQWR